MCVSTIIILCVRQEQQLGWFHVYYLHLAPGEKPGGRQVMTGTRVHVRDFVLLNPFDMSVAKKAASTEAERVAGLYRGKHGNANVVFYLPSRRGEGVSAQEWAAVQA